MRRIFVQAIKGVSPAAPFSLISGADGDTPFRAVKRLSEQRKGYSTVIGLYFGTRTFIRLHAMRYAIPQKQNMMK